MEITTQEQAGRLPRLVLLQQRALLSERRELATLQGELGDFEFICGLCGEESLLPDERLRVAQLRAYIKDLEERTGVRQRRLAQLRKHRRLDLEDENAEFMWGLVQEEKVAF